MAPATTAATHASSGAALAPIPVQQCPAGATASTGGFHVAGGQIIGPSGVFVARGIDVHAGNLSAAAQQIPQQFPGTNLIRVDVDPLDNDPSIYHSAVNEFTSRGTVVQFSDYTNSLGTGGGGGQGVVFTGGLLANELAWFTRMAAHFKGNPYVWLGANNEPPGPASALSDWQKATYDAIRATGNTNMVFLETYGSRPPGYGGTPLQSGMNAGDYAGMTNVVWDPHGYCFQEGCSTDQATVDAEVAALIAAAQTIQSADGVVPVVIGEYSPWDTTTGNSGPGGYALVASVINAGSSGKSSGSAAWVWDDQGQVGGPSGDPLSLVSGGQITQFGQMIQLYANTDVVPLSNCQQTAQAQQQINTLTAQVAASSTATPATPAATASGPATDTTTASDPATEAAIQQATAIAASATAAQQAEITP